MILAFFSVIILFYALALLFAAKVWGKLPQLIESGEMKSVSVLIPFRNEAEHLHTLLESLTALDYPSEFLEIILVNDHSEDEFRPIIESFEDVSSFKILVINLPPQLSGKKSAISAGIKHCQSEIVVTTDADCIFPKDWIQKMQAPFEISHIHMVSGSVVFTTHNFISKLFQMEFAPLIGVGAVSIEMGNPTMANGANLAFRKTTFDELNPYEDNISVASGDDVFLLQKMKAKFPNGIFFQKEAVVETEAPAGLKTFYQQRKRWAAKWRANANWTDSLPALSIWSFHLLYVTAIIYSLISNEFLVLIPMILLKIIAEGIFISSILKSQGKRFKQDIFTILQLFYSPYVLIFGLLANFGSYTWKKRKYNSNE
jgi:cellulose synthase/poly-beta-1,6-N-acetylglucosamine synthase-like glycosyltransferase